MNKKTQHIDTHHSKSSMESKITPFLPAKVDCATMSPDVIFFPGCTTWPAVAPIIAERVDRPRKNPMVMATILASPPFRRLETPVEVSILFFKKCLFNSSLYINSLLADQHIYRWRFQLQSDFPRVTRYLQHKCSQISESVRKIFQPAFSNVIVLRIWRSLIRNYIVS